MDYEPIKPRARVGFIIPSSYRTVERHMEQVLPEGVIPHFTRIGMTNRHLAPLDLLLPRILHDADLLGASLLDEAMQFCGDAGAVEREESISRADGTAAAF